MPRKVRQGRKCPDCGAMVKKMSDHLRFKHKWSQDDANAYSKEMRNKGIQARKPAFGVSGRQRWSCFIEGCGYNVIYRVQHLLQKHKMEKGSAELQASVPLFTKWSPETDAASDSEVTLPDLQQQEPMEEDTLNLYLSETESETELETQSQTQTTETAGGSTTKPPVKVSMFAGDSVTKPSGEGASSGPRPTSMLEALKHYWSFQQTLGGGRKSVEQSDQHSRQIRLFWEATGDTGFGAFTSIRLSDYIESIMTTRRPGTIKSYMGSVKQFVEWLFTNGLIGFSQCVECKNFLINSQRVISKMGAQRQVVVGEEANDELMTTESRNHVLQSKYLPKEFNLFKSNSKQFYNSFRNAMMLLVTISNATRVSVIMNMTVGQLLKASTNTVDGTQYKTISVVQHKTSTSRGACKVTLGVEHFRMLKYLAVYVAEHLPSGNDSLFRFHDGRHFTTQTSVNEQLQSAWKRCGGLSKYGRMNSTLHRKSVTVIARAADPQMAKPAADQLMHRESTADRFYAISTKANASAKFIHFLNRPAAESNVECDMSDDPDNRCTRQHEFPGLDQPIELVQFRRDMFEVFAARPVEELRDDALAWRRNVRSLTLDTSYLSIHRALEIKLKSYAIDVNSEIMEALRMDELAKDYETQSSLLSIIATEIGRFYGCSDDVNLPAFIDVPHQASDSCASATTSMRTVSPPLLLVPDKKQRTRMPDEVVEKITEIYATLIANVRAGHCTISFSAVRELEGDNFPGFSTNQVREKLRNLTKKKNQ